jgi:hypothetical protein
MRLDKYQFLTEALHALRASNLDVPRDPCPATEWHAGELSLVRTPKMQNTTVACIGKEKIEEPGPEFPGISLVCGGVELKVAAQFYKATFSVTLRTSRSV